jgi:beta-lactam-binding protein with PASTA domain
VDAGFAIRTDPAAGELVAKGSPITLYISSGPEPVTMPPLENLTEAAARAKLLELGLTVEVTYQAVPFGDSKNGKVITQSIASGAEVAPGTLVKLKVGQAVPNTTTTSTTSAAHHHVVHDHHHHGARHRAVAQWVEYCSGVRPARCGRGSCAAAGARRR